MKQNSQDHYSYCLGTNTLSSYPKFDFRRLSLNAKVNKKSENPLAENKATLVEINSQMEAFLKERQILFRTALSRKLFFHRYQKFGMDEVHFTEAESNVNDLVWEYGSIYRQWISGKGDQELFDEDADRRDEYQANNGD